MQTVAVGVSAGQACSTVTAWEAWVVFTNELAVNPFLQTICNKIPVLQVFLHSVCSGESSANSNPIQAWLPKDNVWTVAQMFLALGAQDPCLAPTGKIDFCIQSMLAAWKQKDPPQANSHTDPQTNRLCCSKSPTSLQFSPSQCQHDRHCLLFSSLTRGIHGLVINWCNTTHLSKCPTFHSPLPAQPLCCLQCRINANTLCIAHLHIPEKWQRKWSPLSRLQRQSILMPCSGPCLLHAWPLSQQCTTAHTPCPCLYVLLAPGCHFFLHHFSALSGCHLPWYGSRVYPFWSFCLFASVAGAMALLVTNVNTNIILLLGWWHSD